LPIIFYRNHATGRLRSGFFAGGASRFNAPQIRVAPNSPELKQLADVFNAPYTLFSKKYCWLF
jgi:hypothetical protein